MDKVARTREEFSKWVGKENIVRIEKLSRYIKENENEFTKLYGSKGVQLDKGHCSNPLVVTQEYMTTTDTEGKVVKVARGSIVNKSIGDKAVFLRAKEFQTNRELYGEFNIKGSVGRVYPINKVEIPC